MVVLKSHIIITLLHIRPIDNAGFRLGNVRFTFYHYSGPIGRLPWPARVLLVATHADKADCVRNTHGELENPDAYVLLATIKQKYESDLFMQDEIFLVDAHLAMSQDLKSFRAKLGQMKNEIVQVMLSIWLKQQSSNHVDLAGLV